MQTNNLEEINLQKKQFEQEMRDIDKRISQFKEEDDWPELHTWSYEFRKKHNLTSAAFLRDICQLEPLSSYKHLLSINGKERLVSNRPGTLGCALREGINKAKNSKEHIHINDVITHEQLTDCWIEHAQELIRKGVLSIAIESISDSIIAEVDKTLCSTVTEEDIVNFFKSHDIKVECELKVIFCTVELLGASIEISPRGHAQLGRVL